MSNTLALATRLRAIGDDELARIISARELSTTGIKDFFDLAEAFLDRASIQRALTRLDREALAALATIERLATADAPPTISELADALELSLPATESLLERPAALLLVERQGDRISAYDCVTEQISSWPVFGLPSLAELVDGSEAKHPEPISGTELHAIDRLASERAFAATTTVTELLLELEREPARELAKGGIALPDKKRLANAMSIDLDSVAAYLAVADRAGLVSREAGFWLTTEQGNSWLLESTHTRWRALVDGWFVSLLPDIRRVLVDYSSALWGEGLRSHLAWLFPAGGEWMQERVAAFTHDAELLGITANHAPSSAGALLLSGRSADAEAALHPLLPAEVEQVYLQHDLSVVAPGPLTPAVDARLRVIADVENRALAATYRVSAASVNRALASGETAASIFDFLTSVSLTGIPQPLEYLITESAARYGLVRVGELSGDNVSADSPEYGARSYLRSDDTNLLRTILVDQSLASLGLSSAGELSTAGESSSSSGTRVISRYPSDVVFWALSDARYPVAAEDARGAVIRLQRHRVARPTRSSSGDPIGELVERLRLGGEPEPDDNDQAWMAKQLDAAVRGKIALTVSVTMPDGSIVDLQLEPASVAGGRLRARDRNSDIERTLPLSSIASVSPAR